MTGPATDTGPAPPSSFPLGRTALLVIFLGLAVRIFCACHTEVVNTDATFYIQQAKALYHGQSHLVTSGYPLLTNYAILIALAYPLTGDWVTAATAVSVLFGSLVLVPLWWLLRRFFEETVAAAALLAFALCPSFVSTAREIIRGPLYWPFLMLGLYLFVLHLERRRPVLLSLACASLLFAAWARIEAVSLLVVSAGFLLFGRGGGRWRDLAWFLGPSAALLLLGGFNLVLFGDLDIELLGPARIIDRLAGLDDRYGALRESLARWIDQGAPGSIERYFLERVRNLLWFLALGILLVQTVRAFHAPLFLLWAAGLVSARREIRRDPRLVYLCLGGGAALVVLYAQVFHLWAMYSRWIALFLFPAFVFMGYGVARLRDGMARRLGMERSAALALVCLLIIGVSMPKILRYDDRGDKRIFKEIGTHIARLAGDARPVVVAGRFKELILVDFYTHLDYPGAPPFPRAAILDGRGPEGADFLDQEADYLLWRSADPPPAAEWPALAGRLKPLRHWWAPDQGDIILYGLSP